MDNHLLLQIFYFHLMILSYIQFVVLADLFFNIKLYFKIIKLMYIFNNLRLSKANRVSFKNLN